MLIILSPAKTMDMSSPSKGIPSTAPLFEKNAVYLAEKMKQYSATELEKLLKISPKLAQENFGRYQRFDEPDNEAKQALLAYNGSVFRYIGADTFSAEDLQYAQGHLRMISTLYGLVRPLDRIKAYRIAFKLHLDGLPGDLYEYWLPKLSAPLIKDVQNAGGILINLASLDILAALQMDVIRREVMVVDVEFLEYKEGKYQTIRTYAKMARGAMTRHILKNRIEKPEELHAFAWEGFTFEGELSQRNKYIYTKK